MDILILALIAGVVLYKLYRQLGKPVDLDDEDQDTAPVNKFEETKPSGKKAAVKLQPLFSPEAPTDTQEGDEEEDRFSSLHEIDPDFDEKAFLEGASIAYDIILTSLKNGDTKALKPLLSANMFDGFCAEIKRRRSEGVTYETELIGINNMVIQDVTIEENLVTLAVEIESEQVYAVYDGDRNLIEGHNEDLVYECEIWHFQRDMRSSNPNWMLVKIEEDQEDGEDATE